MVILTVSILPIPEYNVYFHLFVSSSIPFISVLQFSEYRSFISLVRFIPRYFILFDAIANGIVSLNFSFWQFIVQFSSVQSLSRVRLFATPWIAACQASLSITNSRSSLKLMSIELVMPSSHLILCRPLLLLHPITPSIRVFSNESTLCIRWPKY